MGRPKDPDYWKKWRSRNPEYRERERLRSRKRKVEEPRGDRSDEYRRRASLRRAKREAELPPALDTDDLLISVRRYVRGRGTTPDYRDHVARDDFEEAVGEVLLAVAEGRSKDAGYLKYRRRKIKWQSNVWTGLKHEPMALEGRNDQDDEW